MDINQQQIEEAADKILTALAGTHKWKWEENRKAILSEFSRDKIEQTLKLLQQQFTHQWDRKSIKKMPKSLKAQLGELTKLSKNQYLFTSPTSENNPSILAIWWPWGHGATVSLRLMILKESYRSPEIIKPKDSFLTIVKNLFSPDNR